MTHRRATGETVWTTAVRSVQDRGFYDNVPKAAENTILMIQIARLFEEAAEYAEASRQPKNRALPELADVAIVLAQIAWLTDLDPDELSNAYINRIPGGSLLYYGGQVARQVVKFQDDAVYRNGMHLACKNLAAWIYITAGQRWQAGPQEFNAAIKAKLDNDERRGSLHLGSAEKEPAASD